MLKLLLVFNRFKDSLFLRYWKYSFLAKIKSNEKSLITLGDVNLRGIKKVKIGKNLTIYPNVSISGDGELIIGDNVQIGEGTLIYSHNKIVIKDNVAIAGQCYIIDCNHSVFLDDLIQNQPLDFDKDGIYIGNDVWIAAGCKIVKGARINDGCVIGALSLVNSEISSNQIAFGIPASERKKRISNKL
jgi:acetyltransferase-like isoleucine patch superfamily enzyme